MKIRIKGNSLRYRLTKSDVNLFSERGYLEEHTSFAGEMLTYALQKDTGNQLFARFKENKITLSIPVSMSDEWILTDRVGFGGDDNGLSLLIEKDFKCLDNVAEDQSDNYPNPLNPYL
jgi:hypothetical protein